MTQILSNSYFLFCLLFGLLLLFTLIMNFQGSYFYTKDVVIRRFSILDLALAASPRELVNIIKGLYELPPAQSKKAIRALKGQLYVDFLFMPCAYGSIFLLCMKVAARMQLQVGYYAFVILAFAQLVAWICDVVENIYLLKKIQPQPVLSAASRHRTFLLMEAIKWFISLTGAVFSISAIFYFWLSGHYSFNSLSYLLVVVIELVLFGAIHFFLLKKKPVDITE